MKKLDSLGVDGARVARENIERGFKGKIVNDVGL